MQFAHRSRGGLLLYRIGMPLPICWQGAIQIAAQVRLQTRAMGAAPALKARKWEENSQEMLFFWFG
ncbi:hypothetical protein, partial [Bifidobacterium animalis]|uniref:hypothetical protein n=1 Tax=Bifidobacterium animalis TaxID=28025 RepID=UPI0019D381B2